MNEERALSMIEARDKLMQLPEDFEQIVKEGEVFPIIKVIRNNEPVLAILAWETYASIMETLEVLSDDEQMEALRQALLEVGQGQAKPWNA
jgi:PHD/YefM family antitoxin component YafN of YafNO toxin-antitoxin module